jgi:hypothetical protein
MAIFEHNPNFEGTSKVNGASRKTYACYTLNRWKKAAAHSLADGSRNLDTPSQNSLQDALPNYCPNHCTSLCDDHADDPPDPQSHLPSFCLLSPQNVLQPTSVSWHLLANNRGDDVTLMLTPIVINIYLSDKCIGYTH